LLVGQASGAAPSLAPLSLMLGNQGVLGVLAIPQPDPTAEAEVWATLETLAAERAITTPVGSVYGYEDVPAMVAGQAEAAPGKIVVRVA
jgi:NADPH2:quinone reductase